MDIPVHSPWFLAAAVLCSVPAQADAAAQKAAFTVIREEVGLQFSAWASQNGQTAKLEAFAKWSGKADKRDPALPFEPVGKFLLPKAFLTTCWPYDSKAATEPPRGALMFSDWPDLETQATPAAYAVQFARYVAALGDWPLPYVGATRLRQAEGKAVADKLAAMFGGDKPRWREAVPLARQGTIHLGKRAIKLLSETLVKGIYRFQREIKEGDQEGQDVTSAMIDISNEVIKTDDYYKKYEELRKGFAALAKAYGPAGK